MALLLSVNLKKQVYQGLNRFRQIQLYARYLRYPERLDIPIADFFKD